jgi:hypothetical protein
MLIHMLTAWGRGDPGRIAVAYSPGALWTTAITSIHHWHSDCKRYRSSQSFESMDGTHHTAVDHSDMQSKERD